MNKTEICTSKYVLVISIFAQLHMCNLSPVKMEKLLANIQGWWIAENQVLVNG